MTDATKRRSDTARPNLILITADQWRADCLSCLQSDHPVMTPHLDQLASEGTLFSQAYADCPLCMPQRVTFLTGQVASRFGRPSNFNARTPIDPATSLPALLTRRAGYQTKAIGKMHFHPDRARFGFEHVTLFPNDYVNYLEEVGLGGRYRGHGLGGNEVHAAVSAVPEEHSHTHWVVDEAIKFLHQRDPDYPFFLWLVFEAPHSPFDPPPPYDRFYDRFEIPEPVTGAWAEGDAAPAEFRKRRLRHNFDYLTPDMIRASRRAYYGLCTHIDYQLGRFFGELQRMGLYQESAIAFCSDHGEHLGDHGVFGKATFLRGGGDIPLIVRLPRSRQTERQPQRIDRPALSADLCPTLLSLAGLEPEADCDGESLLPWLAGEAPRPRTIFGEHTSTAFAFDGRYKFIYYPAGGVEHLFDLQADPHETTNVCDRPELRARSAALRDELTAYLQRFDRPMVEDGRLRATDAAFDRIATRRSAPQAIRGPLRFGQGY